MASENDHAHDRELMRVIGRIEGKIDGMMSSLSSLHDEHKDLKANHSILVDRVNKIENRLYLYAGVVAVISPVAFMVLKPIVGMLFGTPL